MQRMLWYRMGDKNHMEPRRRSYESEISMKLRPYQEECNKAVIQALAINHSALVEMATGLGKTVCFAHIANEWPGRVLVLAHRDELIRQAADKIALITGRCVAIEMGKRYASTADHGPKITVASIQTLARACRRERFHPDHFSLLIIDEGHHAAAVTYREVMNYFKSAKRIFVTATPKRADKVALGHVCDVVAYQYGIEPAIDDGWLVPVKQTVVKVEGLDFSKARTVAEDFNQADLERILTEEKPLHQMVASAHEIIGGRQALWFCTSIAHANATARVLGRYVDESQVEFLCGDTPSDRRRDIVRAYKEGRIQHLINCALFLEGFDAPNTSAIVMGRPTKSLGLYMQVLGRGTRPLPGIVDIHHTAAARRQAIAMSNKPSMVVIDFAGNAGRHAIIQAADVLGGKKSLPVREYAKSTMEQEGRTVDLEEALDRAEAEVELLAQEDKRRKKIVAVANYKTYDIDPFVRQYREHTHTVNHVRQLCSKKQAGYICFLAKGKWKYADALALSASQAGAIITQLKRGK